MKRKWLALVLLCSSAMNFAAYAATDASQEIDDSKYYFIVSAHNSETTPLNIYDDKNRWLSTQNEVADKQGIIDADIPTNSFCHDSLDHVQALWQLRSTENGYCLYNLNAHTGLDFTPSDTLKNDYHYNVFNTHNAGSTFRPVSVEGQEGIYYIQATHTQKATYLYHAAEKTAFTYLGARETVDEEQNDTVAQSDSKFYWKLVEANHVPMTIKSGSTYTAVNYPFAITLPETLTAYIVTAADNSSLTLTEIRRTNIPAHTPLIITDGVTSSTDARHYHVAISYQEGGALEDNLLEGTTTRRTGFSAGENYFLSTAGDFRRNAAGVNYIPANKAYLPATKVTSGAANALRLDMALNDNTTGIDALPTTEKEEVYYDLNGRRVLYPSAGIFVTAAGKKVLFP